LLLFSPHPLVELPSDELLSILTVLSTVIPLLLHAQVLQLLWDLSHLPALSTHLVELALEEHLAILNDSYTVKDQIKRNYVGKCVEDIKKVGKKISF